MTILRKVGSRDSAVGKATRLRAGPFGGRIATVVRHFLFTTAQTGAGAHTLSYQWIPCFFPASKAAWPESGHSPSSNAEIRNEWSYTSTPLVCLHGVDRDGCIFAFTFVFKMDILYPCIAFMCAEYQFLEVQFSISLRELSNCLFLELPTKYSLYVFKA
jgi:hypothetical protein